MLPPLNCPYGCANFANLRGSHNTFSQETMDGFWFDKTRMDTTSCAIPANIGVPGTAMCWCAGIPAALTAEWGYCLSPRTPYPQQVNIQYGSSDRELQIAFVTEDFDLPVVSPPIVEVCVVGDAGCFNVTGRSTRVPEPQLPSRILTFSFVPLPTSLTLPGAHFTYRALPGTSPADWSEAFLVTLPPPQQRERTYALFGDQGLYPYSSVGNLLSDLAGGKIDSVIHLGDLAYNMEMGNGSRGDGYMYALEPLLSKIPWVPTMGNHEIEGSPFGVYCNSSVYCEGRYLNQTGGYLVAGNASGSGTNLYYSLDLGLLHLVVVNTMPYLGLRADLRDRQMEWLEADLAAASHPAQRASVPWIVVASHVPMYCSANGEEHVGDEAKQDLEPLLYKYGVDLYTYGHVHAYESTWPVFNNTVLQKNLFNPRATVHLLTGAGGPPGSPDQFPKVNGPFTRKTYSSWSYGQLKIFNASHMAYTHFDNAAGEAVDEWTIVQENHGPFS